MLALGSVSPSLLASISRVAMKQESNTRPSVFKWWGRRPVAIVRAFLALAAGAGEEDALGVALGRRESFERVRRLVSGRRLLDPFAGSGVIPVEASRLGYTAVGQDVNPYAVAVAEAYAELCMGGCKAKSECLWGSLARSWGRVRGLWCRGDSCIVHVLLARCPPCTAPVWVSSARSGSSAKRALVLTEDYSLEWRDPRDLSPGEPRIPLPAGLPQEAPGYVAYALEYYHRGARRWVSLASRDRESVEWRRFLEETARVAKPLAASSGGVRVPLMEETRRLYRHGVTTTLGLFTWRQAATYALVAREAWACRREMALAVANAMQSGSLLAMYYQPMAKVNPGLVVKSYWLPRNPVELNPVANTRMPHPPAPSARPVGRGTLVSIIQRYGNACWNGNGCVEPPTILLGDSTRNVPGSGYDIIATDPPYPGLHTYRDMSLLYAHASMLAGLRVPPEWSEVDTRDPESYKAGVLSAMEKSLSKAVKGGVVLLFISSPSPEGISTIAELLEELARLGIGYEAIYPVIAENPGALGRSASRVVFVVAGRLGIPTRRGFLDPLSLAWRVAREVGLREGEARYAGLVSSVLSDALSIRLA